jgi:rRNA maturation protein Nop10
MRKRSPSSVPTPPSYDYNPCPACGKQVRKVHAWCGYCGQQLQIRCPRCQVWTLFGHQVCPECGVALHAAYHGLTTEQEGQRAALQHQLQVIKAEQTLCQDHLSEISAQRRRAYLRVALVLSLLLGGCVGVVNLFQKMTSTIGGVIVLIALAWMFRFILPGMARALWRMVRWALPEIEPLRHALAEEERALRDLEQSACEIQAHIAALRAVDSSPLLEPVEERTSEEDKALDEEVGEDLSVLEDA